MKKNRTFGIIGFGRFGKLWAECLKNYGDILVYDKKKENMSIQTQTKNSFKIISSTLTQVVNADILFLLVPISELESCCKEIKQLLTKNTVVIEACSVKVYPLTILKKNLPKDQPFIATHPLFGPGTVKKPGLAGEKIAICFSRCSKKQKESFENLLKDMKLKIIRASAKKHDREMANSQALIHFLGRSLTPLQLQSQKVSTPNYEALMQINKIVKSNSWQLFLDMQKYNPFAGSARQKLISSLQEVEENISGRHLNVKKIKKIPDSSEIIAAFPLSKKAEKQVARDKQEVKNILSGKDKRLLVIIGPCSAWPSEAVLEYARRLKKIEEKVKNTLKIILRVYIQKPRTTKGWTGPVNQPDPFAPPDIQEGIKYCRKLMVQVIEMGFPIADEAVFTHNSKGFIELLSWVAIGARSTEDQEHRIHASAIECAVGMKNPTSGSLEIGVNSIVAAQHEHTAVFNGYQVETSGNPFAHLVLRGGASGPNYHLENISEAKKHLERQQVKNQAIIVDASHDNCKINGIKNPNHQRNIAREVLTAMEENPEIQKIVKGFMFESFLKSGCQKTDNLTKKTVNRDGLSITDPCMDWEETEKMILEIEEKYKALMKRKN